MRIAGLQKLTLLDYPGTVACTVFTAGCNLRCPFCHNAPLVLPERNVPEQTVGEFMTFLKKRQGVLEGVAITGGEPLLHADISEFLRDIRKLGYKIKLDTNGTNPKLLRQIVEEGLVDRVAMDIKTCPEKYAEATGVPGLDIGKIAESKDFLMSGAVDHEFRTTAVKGIHSLQDIADAAKWIAGAEEYYLQQFKNSGDIIDINGLSAFDENEMRALADAAARFVPSVKLRGI